MVTSRSYVHDFDLDGTDDYSLECTITNAGENCNEQDNGPLDISFNSGELNIAHDYLDGWHDVEDVYIFD